MFDLKNKTVTIVGAQRSGKAIAKLVQERGGRVKISEKAEAAKLDPEFVAWAKSCGAQLEFGGHTKSFIQASDLIVLSPGVPLKAEPVRWANDSGICILGEIEFAYQFCALPVIAVTGSNGKTTVVTLITEVLKAAGHRPILCGNVGAPFSNYVSQLANYDYVVLEVSSFQMEALVGPQSPFRKNLSNGHLSIKGFQPRVAVLLNFSENHLDRHADLEEYWRAKARIFLNQEPKDFAILNFADERSRGLEKSLAAKVVYFNSGESQQKITNPNHLAVLEVAKVLGISAGICLEVFKNFKGVEHRMEWVRQLNGVDYINDSKATTAEAGRWALERMNQPVLLLCGGSEKGIDYSVLSDIVKKKVKKMFVYGAIKGKLKKTFEELVDLESCGTFDEAIQKARATAAQGDCILLSPMTASFDMFKDYEDRGRTFKKIVQSL